MRDYIKKLIKKYEPQAYIEYPIIDYNGVFFAVDLAQTRLIPNIVCLDKNEFVVSRLKNTLSDDCFNQLMMSLFFYVFQNTPDKVIKALEEENATLFEDFYTIFHFTPKEYNNEMFFNLIEVLKTFGFFKRSIFLFKNLPANLEIDMLKYFDFNHEKEKTEGYTIFLPKEIDNGSN